MNNPNTDLVISCVIIGLACIATMAIGAFYIMWKWKESLQDRYDEIVYELSGPDDDDDDDDNEDRPLIPVDSPKTWRSIK